MKDSSFLKIKHQEDGFASIIVALVLLVVISLMSVGFAQLARQESTNSLNSQEASQAYYAAESGINDAYSDILNGYITDGNTNDNWQIPAATTHVNADANTCMTPSSATYGTAVDNNPIPSEAATSSLFDIDSTNQVGVKCLLVNLNPASISSNISTGDLWYQTFTTTTPLTSLLFSWGSSGAGINMDHYVCSSNDEFLPVGGWNEKDSGCAGSTDTTKAAPLLQVNVTEIGQSESRSSLLTNTLSFYLYPSGSPSSNGCSSGISDCINYIQNSGSYGSSGNGQIVNGDCKPSDRASLISNWSSNNLASTSYQPEYACNAVLTGLDNGGTYDGPYLITVTPYYNNAEFNMSLSSPSDDESGATNFANAAAIIDVTAQAHNTLKRIVETLPINPKPSLSAFGIEAGSVCKRLTSYPDGNPNPTVYYPVGGSSTDNQAIPAPSDSDNTDVTSSSGNECILSSQ